MKYGGTQETGNDRILLSKIWKTPNYKNTPKNVLKATAEKT